MDIETTTTKEKLGIKERGKEEKKNIQEVNGSGLNREMDVPMSESCQIVLSFLYFYFFGSSAILDQVRRKRSGFSA